MTIPAEIIALLRKPALCYVSTINPDGAPQLTQTWVDTDGQHVLLNTVQGFRKLKNLERDPRVTLAVSDPKQHFLYHELRGRLIASTVDGAVDHIEQLSQRYLGKPYPWFGGRDQVRVLLTIEVDKIMSVG